MDVFFFNLSHRNVFFFLHKTKQHIQISIAIIIYGSMLNTSDFQFKKYFLYEMKKIEITIFLKTENH